MSKDKTARLNRLLTNGRCLDIALDHGVCNEPSFLNGLEDMPQVMDKLVAAAPDAIQLNYGQADLLQDCPGRNKPALVMRIDMGNPYNATAHRVMWALLQNEHDPVLPAVQRDAACVVVNLFMLPNEPDLFRQCVQNIARVRADCDRYGMPLMIEPLVMRPHSDQGGYMVDGDAEKIVTLVRLAREMGADLVHAWMSRANSFIPMGLGCPVLGWFGDYYDLKYFRRTDCYVGVTPDIAAYLRRQGTAPERTASSNAPSSISPPRAASAASSTWPCRQMRVASLRPMRRMTAVMAMSLS